MNCRVVLVRPRIASNIGAVARVMRNLGLTDLVLVAPQADPADPRAERLATRHGRPVLQSARVVADLADAVGDCLMVAGTSALVGGLCRRQSVGSPEEMAPKLVQALAAGTVALVFGPEPSGLTNEEVVRCHCLIHIPADPTYPALNLAQAVAICLYVLALPGCSKIVQPHPPAAGAVRGAGADVRAVASGSGGDPFSLRPQGRGPDARSAPPDGPSRADEPGGEAAPRFGPADPLVRRRAGTAKEG